jgi:flagellar protein FliT
VTLRLVESVDYKGASGIAQLHFLKDELKAAFTQENWQQVRVLDQACMALLQKINASDASDKVVLILALRELKNIYATLVVQCHSCAMS